MDETKETQLLQDHNQTAIKFKIFLPRLLAKRHWRNLKEPPRHSSNNFLTIEKWRQSDYRQIY